MALPWLDLMHNSSSAAANVQDAADSYPVRMACLFFANGAIIPDWKPTGTGTDFQLSKTLQPLQNLREDLTIFGGLTQNHARANGDGPGDHARNASAFLTGAQPRKTSGADIRAGVSIDQAVAEQVGWKTRLPSLELGIDRGRNAGNCDSGYSCAYSSNISWKSETTPCGKEVSPRAVFERLFGAEESEADRERRRLDRRSILDFVAEDARKVQQVAGTADRQKLDEYFSSVREIEKRIERAFKPPKDVPRLDLPDGVPTALQEHIRLMFDILLIAFQTDSTRICTMMLADAGSNRTYPDIGITSGHHELSHHQDDPEKIRQISLIDRYLVEQLGYFLQKLKDTKEGERNLLQNSMILYGSAIADGNQHNHEDLPILLAGQGGGTIRSGRFIEHPLETPLNNLFVSMAERMGTNIVQHGDSKGALDLS
jgi:hypothetical protein